MRASAFVNLRIICASVGQLQIVRIISVKLLHIWYKGDSSLNPLFVSVDTNLVKETDL